MSESIVAFHDIPQLSIFTNSFYNVCVTYLYMSWHHARNSLKVVLKLSVPMSFLDGLGDVVLAIHNHMAACQDIRTFKQSTSLLLIMFFSNVLITELMTTNLQTPKLVPREALLISAALGV